MVNRGTGGGRQDKAVGVLSAAVWVLTAMLVAVVITGSYWWAQQENVISKRKIDRLKRELEICRKEMDDE